MSDRYLFPAAAEEIGAIPLEQSSPPSLVPATWHPYWLRAKTPPAVPWAIPPASTRWRPGFVNVTEPPVIDQMPWVKRTPPIAFADYPNTHKATRWDESFLGLGPAPVDMLPWFHKPWQDHSWSPQAKAAPFRPFPIVVIPIPPTVPRDRGHRKPFIARDPKVDQRMRRFSELVTDVLNSLIGGGYIEQTGAGAWALANPPFNEGRDPQPSDDTNAGVRAGDHWYNRVTGKLYFCVSASAGAANWIVIN